MLQNINRYYAIAVILQLDKKNERKYKNKKGNHF